MRVIAKPTDDPVVADQRVADALESVLSNAADRAFVLVAVAMATKAHRLDAKREAMDEFAKLAGTQSEAAH